MENIDTDKIISDFILKNDLTKEQLKILVQYPALIGEVIEFAINR